MAVLVFGYCHFDQYVHTVRALSIERKQSGDKQGESRSRLCGDGVRMTDAHEVGEQARAVVIGNAADERSDHGHRGLAYLHGAWPEMERACDGWCMREEEGEGRRRT